MYVGPKHAYGFPPGGMFMLAGGLPARLFDPFLLISTHAEHMCGVGGWCGVFKDVVVGNVEQTWNTCVGWGGVGCLKTLWLDRLNTRGTYVWVGWVGGVGCSKTLLLHALNMTCLT